MTLKIAAVLWLSRYNTRSTTMASEVSEVKLTPRDDLLIEKSMVFGVLAKGPFRQLSPQTTG